MLWRLHFIGPYNNTSKGIRPSSCDAFSSFPLSWLLSVGKIFSYYQLSPVSCYYLLQSHYKCSFRLYPTLKPEFIFVLSFICFSVYHPLGPFISSPCCGLLSRSDLLSNLLTTTVTFHLLLPTLL